MVLKSSLLLLVLAVSQVFATSVLVLQLRGLDVLESRQSGCPICTTVSETLSTCAASGSSTIGLRCACSSAVASQVQSCVDCGIAANVGAASVQKLVDSYNQLCPGSPATDSGSTTTSVPKASSGTSQNGKRVSVAAIGAIVGVALVL